MKYVYWALLSVMLWSCSSDTESKGQAEVRDLFGSFSFTSGVSTEKGSTRKFTFTQLAYLSDSANRPGIVGGVALAMFRNLSAEERDKQITYEVIFEGNGKEYSFEISNASVKELYQQSLVAESFVQSLVRQDKSAVEAMVDAVHMEVPSDSLMAFPVRLGMGTSVDSVQTYMAQPLEYTGKDGKALKVYKYFTWVYLGKKTFYYNSYVDRKTSKLVGVVIRPKEEQREFALPL